MNIYKNLWAGYDCYFVPTHTDKSKARGYRVHNAYGEWKVDKAWFAKETIEDAEHFPKVGEIDLNKIIIENVLKDKSVRDAINGLPSAEPERKTGKWEYIQYDGNPKIGNWHCSNCRLIVNLGFEGAPYYDYCPGCGARMGVDNG